MTTIGIGTKVAPASPASRTGGQSRKNPGREQRLDGTTDWSIEKKIDPEAAGAFLQHLTANLTGSTGAVLSKEAASLRAADTKQRLLGSTLSIANQRPHVILALFAQENTSA